MQEIINEIIVLLVGCAVFITGMNMMSSGLKKATGRGLKNLLRKIQNSRIAGLGIGVAVTALIQSSGATAVMVVGFVSAGIMTMFQATSVLLGSFIGTTVTGLIASMSSFPISKYLLLCSIIGVILMFFKKDKVKHIGEIVCGLGLIFFGLDTMKGAFLTDGSVILEFSQNLFASVSNPILLLIIGCLFTALVQSSSATSGIVIVMAGAGAISLGSGFYLVLGATVGTVIVTLIATIGGNSNVKRVGFISLVIKAITASLGTLVVWLFEDQLTSFFINVFKTNELAVAMFLMIYSIIFFTAMLPFIKPIVLLSEKVIKERPNKNLIGAVQYIDDHFLDTPTIAMMQTKREIMHMMELAYANIELGFNRIVTQNPKDDKTLIDTEEKIDYINKDISEYLIKLSPRVDSHDERKVGAYFHVINDIERIGDHAYNFYDLSNKMIEDELKFSDAAVVELKEMFDVIKKMCVLSTEIFDTKNKELLPQLHSLEERTDELKNDLSTSHYIRITKNQCKNELTSFYTTLVTELERVADHIVNVGYSIDNPTGDDD